MAANPHDTLFKHTFSRPEHAAPELRAVLPRALSAAIDWSTLALEPGTFVDQELRWTHSDLLFSATLSGKPALLYLLFEHQSTADRLMPLRLLGYLAKVWESQLKDTPSLSPLPPVIPVVLHHDPAGWQMATHMHQLLDPLVVAMPELAALQPAFSFVLDDLAKVSDKALLARALGPLATLTLWLFRDGRSPGKVAARLRRWGPQMLTLLERSGGRSELVTLLRYLFEVVDKRSFEKVEREIRALPAPIAEVGMTIAELLKKRGFDEGKRLGLDEGKRLGLDEGKQLGLDQGLLLEARKALRRVLARRGFVLEARHEASIERCDDLAMLERWLDAAVTAPTLNDALR